MNTFTCKLEPGDNIYVATVHGLTMDVEIDSIQFGKYGTVTYLDKYGDKICYDSTLDVNAYRTNELYFTTKAKRDNALKQLHV